MSDPAILQTAKNLGYVVFDGGPFDLNIIGVRAKVPVVNTFCDQMHVVYREVAGGPWIEKVWPITTDPGTYYLNAPIHESGTGILCPGQYRGSHSIGLHHGSYEALVQTGKLKIWLDSNKDSVLDHTHQIEGTGYGINIHHAGEHSTVVNNWSAGCSVFANLADFNEFMVIVKKAAEKWGKTFTYTLIQET